MNTQFSKVDIGKIFSLDYALYIKCNKTNKIISPFHDIPYIFDSNKNLFNMIVEIPRWSNAKMEISTKTPFNPIKQDQKNGKPRFVHNIFPHHGYPWNYGAIPQTWEDPNVVDKYVNAKGDNDPIDALEIGEKVLERGTIYTVKIIGCVALIDEGEADWKIFTINSSDSLFDKINSIEDLKLYKPGLLESSINWFKCYKVPAGKGYNSFAFNGEYKPAEFAKEIVNSCHKHWKELICGNTLSSGLCIKCTNVDYAVEKFSCQEIDDATNNIEKEHKLIPKESIPQPPSDTNNSFFVRI